ncbi:MAG: hypothetical protein Q9181_005845 [Wetmoreana brouardii]
MVRMANFSGVIRICSQGNYEPSDNEGDDNDEAASWDDLDGDSSPDDEDSEDDEGFVKNSDPEDKEVEGEDDWVDPADGVDSVSDPDVRRFEDRFQFVVHTVKASAEQWDMTRPWKDCAFSKRWHLWWTKVDAVFLIGELLGAIPTRVRRLLGRQTLDKNALLGLPDSWRDSRMGVYVDILEYGAGPFGIYTGSATSQAAPSESQRGLWIRVRYYSSKAEAGEDRLREREHENAHMKGVANPDNTQHPPKRASESGRPNLPQRIQKKRSRVITCRPPGHASRGVATVQADLPSVRPSSPPLQGSCRSSRKTSKVVRKGKVAHNGELDEE